MRITLFLGCILIQLSVFAFRFTDDFNLGIYWGSLPIKVTKVAATVSEGQQLDSIVRRAESEWESIAGLEIWDDEDASVVGGTQFRNTIRWSNNFGGETGFSPLTTLAVTVRHRSGTFFEYFEIILNGENPGLRSNAGDMLYETMLHELGHVLGIGHSERRPAVMEPTLVGHSFLQSDDQDAVIAITNETLRRQEVNFVSALASQEQESNGVACASVTLGSGGGGGGPFQIALGFILVLMVSLLTQKRQKVPVMN